jgi:hypothetical protein
MREIRLSGSEGGGGREASPYPYLPAGQDYEELSDHLCKTPLTPEFMIIFPSAQIARRSRARGELGWGALN